MRNLTLFAYAFATLFLYVAPAYACSGFNYSSIEDISRDELVVAASVVDVGDRGINAILQVDRYFKGSGDEYVAVMRHPPALHYAGEVRKYETGCLYSGDAGHKWQLGSYGYFPLSANDNGTYRDDTNYEGISAQYIPQDGIVEFYSKNAGKYGDYVALPTDEFEALLLRLSKQSQTTEPQSNPYPLMRFLNITTLSGQRYRLNPDRSITRLNPAEYPIAISNDGSHVMFRLDKSKLGFQYLELRKKPFDWSYGSLRSKPGVFAQFSPDSNLVAIQEAERLTVYLFHSVSGSGGPGYGHRMFMMEVASFELEWLSAEKKAPLAWSANSRVLAYQDAQGIWMLDLFDQAEPQLILPVDESHVLLDLSDTGRYLRYSGDGLWILLDLQTGETWHNTLVSPDESRLIHIQADLAEEDTRRAGVVDRNKGCYVPLSNCPVAIRATKPNFVFWFEPGFIGLVSSTTVMSFPWHYTQSGICCRGKINGYDLPKIVAFAFDATYNLPVFAFDETMIGINLWSAGLFESVDLSEYLDSPIVDLEWGQPIFLDRR